MRIYLSTNRAYRRNTKIRTALYHLERKRTSDLMQTTRWSVRCSRDKPLGSMHRVKCKGKQWPDLKFITFGRRPSAVVHRRGSGCQKQTGRATKRCIERGNEKKKKKRKGSAEKGGRKEKMHKMISLGASAVSRILWRISQAPVALVCRMWNVVSLNTILTTSQLFSKNRRSFPRASLRFLNDRPHSFTILGLQENKNRISQQVNLPTLAFLLSLS